MAYQLFYFLLSATLDEVHLEVAVMLAWWGTCNSQPPCKVESIVFGRDISYSFLRCYGIKLSKSSSISFMRE